jgi:alanine racemase
LEDDEDFKQIERLKQVKKTLTEKGIDVPTLSIASSHGVFLRPESSLDAVRPGVMLFGWYPMPEARETGVELHQALCLKGRLEHVKWVEPGTPLTYGGAFVAPKRMKVGTMHMGYSDGYLRQLSKKGIVNVKGKICPIIGGVSINHLIVDLSDTDAEIGDVVEAISLTGENDAHSLCELAGVEPYQLAVWMSPITPRVYYMDGKPVALVEPELG